MKLFYFFVITTEHTFHNILLFSHKKNSLHPEIPNKDCSRDYGRLLTAPVYFIVLSLAK